MRRDLTFGCVERSIMLNLTALMDAVKNYDPLLKRSEDGPTWELFIYVPGRMASEESLGRVLSPFLPSEFQIIGWYDEVPDDEICECIIYF
jgi:hypothetical protein